jgi:hypothetical protein
MYGTLQQVHTLVDGRSIPERAIHVPRIVDLVLEGLPSGGYSYLKAPYDEPRFTNH